jgi:hypothetical protein
VAVFAAHSGGTDLQSKLTATAQFSQVDYTNCSSPTVPSVAAMSAYDALVIYTYNTVVAGFGDNLKTYLESGGGVVVMDYNTQETGSYLLKGAYEGLYTLMPAGSFISPPVDLGATAGTILDPNSPLLAGVNVVRLPSGGKHMKAVPVAGTTVVANWSDGAPAVMWNTINGHRVAEINMFGTSSTLSGSGWDSTTDGARLIANALRFTIPGPLVTTSTQIDAGSQALYTSGAPVTITYTNPGASPRTLTALSLTGVDPGDFSITPSMPLPVVLPAGGTFTVDVVFRPSHLGLRAATLTAVITGATSNATTLLTGTGT